MKISTRSVLMAGLTTLTATAVAIAPSVQPPPPPAPARTVLLAADVQPLAQPLAPTTLSGWVQRILIPPNFGTPPPPPPPIVVPTPGSIGSSIIDIYEFVEPWVHYGFEIAQYVVGWIPWVGWLAPQIDIFYHLGERIVRSITFNIANWLDGNVSFGQGLVNVGVDTINSFITFGIDQWDFWIGFPLPPLPGIFTTPEQATMLAGAPEVGVTNVASDLVNAVYVPIRNGIDYGVNVFQAVLAPIPVVRIAGDQVNLLWDTLVRPIADSAVDDLINPVLNAPLNINSYINGAIAVGSTTVNSLIATGFAEVDYFLGGPFLSEANTVNSTEFKMSEVSTVPSIVKTPFAPLDSLRTRINSGADVDEPEATGPLTEVTKTVRNVRNEIRANFNAATERRTEGTASSGLVRAQGEVRGGVAKAANDVVNAVRGDKSDGAAEDVAKAPGTVAKSLGDTARNVVKEVRQAAKDVREAAKDRVAADDE
jgi:hypothetical protein